MGKSKSKDGDEVVKNKVVQQMSCKIRLSKCIRPYCQVEDSQVHNFVHARKFSSPIPLSAALPFLQ